MTKAESVSLINTGLQPGDQQRRKLVNRFKRFILLKALS